MGLQFKIHREGYRFVLIFAAITLITFFFGREYLGWFGELLGWVFVALTAWCAYFFRDPDRVVPQADGLAIAPADGLICAVDKVKPPEKLGLGDGERWRVSIFMNVFNVHVNRVPVAGRITHLHYVPGKFLNASLDKASEDNERQLIAMETADGKTLGFVQIAGLVARRILCEVEVGQEMAAGERFGLIRFGSRVDVYLDPAMEPLAIIGQKTVAGETVLADARFSEQQRSGQTL